MQGHTPGAAREALPPPVIPAPPPPPPPRRHHPPPTPAARPAGPGSPPPPRRTPTVPHPDRGAPSPGSASLCSAPHGGGRLRHKQLPASPRRFPVSASGPGPGPARARRSATHPRTASPCPAAAAATARCPPGCCRRSAARDCLIPGSQQGRVSCQAPRSRACSRLTEGAAPLSRFPCPSVSPTPPPGGRRILRREEGGRSCRRCPRFRSRPWPLRSLRRRRHRRGVFPASPASARRPWASAPAGAWPGPARSAPPRPGTGRTRGRGRTRTPRLSPLAGARGWAGRQQRVGASGRQAGRKVAAEGPVGVAGALCADGSVRAGGREGGGGAGGGRGGRLGETRRRRTSVWRGPGQDGGRGPARAAGPDLAQRRRRLLRHPDGVTRCPPPSPRAVTHAAAARPRPRARLPPPLRVCVRVCAARERAREEGGRGGGAQGRDGVGSCARARPFHVGWARAGSIVTRRAHRAEGPDNDVSAAAAVWARPGLPRCRRCRTGPRWGRSAGASLRARRRRGRPVSGGCSARGSPGGRAALAVTVCRGGAACPLTARGREHPRGSKRGGEAGWSGVCAAAAAAAFAPVSWLRPGLSSGRGPRQASGQRAVGRAAELA